MSALQVAVRDGCYVCYRTDDGIRREYLSCSHARPREAVRHTSGSYTSPLRASDGAPTFVPSAPLAGTESLGAPSEPRLGRPDPSRP